MAKNVKKNPYVITYQQDGKLKRKLANKRNVMHMANRLRRKFRGVTITKIGE